MLLSFSWTSTNVGAQGQTCHLRELDLCATSLLVFTQSPGGLATSEQEVNKQCVHLRDADTCFRNYTRRCMTPIQREVVTFASNSSLQLLNEYCTRGSSIRTSYLKYSQCFNQIQKKEQRSCTRDLQASLELFAGSSNEAGKRFQLACCTYRRFQSCLGGQIEKKCGKEAFAFVTNLVRRATSRLPETMCRQYKPDGQECKSLLPKPGTLPKGAKSNSIVSRLLSAYSGL